MLTAPGDTIESSDFIKKSEQSADPTDDENRVPKIESNGRVHSDFTMPAGVFFPFAGASAQIPSGFLLCDGSAVSRTTYADLFAAIGVLWGAGNGTTTFNLPSLKGRVPVGYDAAQTEFDTVGEQGGEKTHLLTGAESGEKGHNHATTAQKWFGTRGTNDHTGSPTGSDVTIGFQAALNTAAPAADAASAHNNLQPYVTAHYIIKT